MDRAEKNAPPTDQTASPPPADDEARERVRHQALMVNAQGVIVARDASEEYRLVKQMQASEALPASFGNADQLLVAFQMLRSYQVNPILGIRNCAIIRGVTTIWGELPKALCLASGALTRMEEFRFDKDYARICFDNKNLHHEVFGCLCRVLRRDQVVVETFFTRLQAEEAGLLNPSAKGRDRSVWNKYTGRMLQMRARSQALKDAFPDVLMGLSIDEYDNDRPQMAMGEASVIEAKVGLGGAAAAASLNEELTQTEGA